MASVLEAVRPQRSSALGVASVLEAVRPQRSSALGVASVLEAVRPQRSSALGVASVLEAARPQRSSHVFSESVVLLGDWYAPGALAWVLLADSAGPKPGLRNLRVPMLITLASLRL